MQQEKWSSYYKPCDNSDSDPSSQSSSSTLVCSFVTMIHLYSMKIIQVPICDDFFDELDDFGTESTIDKLEEYLKTLSISTKVLEPLNWWYAIEEVKPSHSYGD